MRLDPSYEPAHVLGHQEGLTWCQYDDPTWFKRAVFYEVLLRSFKDSDADGVGDFRGLREKLDYLAVAGHRLPLDPAVLHLAAA